MHYVTKETINSTGSVDRYIWHPTGLDLKNVYEKLTEMGYDVKTKELLLKLSTPVKREVYKGLEISVDVTGKDITGLTIDLDHLDAILEGRKAKVALKDGLNLVEGNIQLTDKEKELYDFIEDNYPHKHSLLYTALMTALTGTVLLFSPVFEPIVASA